jgi:hypothetical protein
VVDHPAERVGDQVGVAVGVVRGAGDVVAGVLVLRLLAQDVEV